MCYIVSGSADEHGDGRRRDRKQIVSSRFGKEVPGASADSAAASTPSASAADAAANAADV